MIGFYTTFIYIASYIGLFAAIFYLLSLRDYYRRSQPRSDTLPPVSIIIPAYNEEGSIGPTIVSALALDYPSDKLDIIVVDDGSRDRTYAIAQTYLSPRVRVFTKPNGGKGSALNVGIRNSTSEIIVTMDADTFVDPLCLRKMVALFYSPQVMAVTPSMVVHKSRSIWQRIQQVEYSIGVYLRKAFSTVNVMHVTPGAFSAYRRVFFTKHGGFDEHNITEDTEIALRIQDLNYRIENEPHAIIYTIAPRTFNELMVQRRRWYTGLIKNLWSYRRLFGLKKGLMGVFSLPLAMFTIFSTIFLTSYFLIKTFDSLHRELIYLQSINFDFLSVLDFNLYVFHYFLYMLLSYKIFLLSLLFTFLLAGYLYFSKRHVPRQSGLLTGFFPFLILYGFLFSFWWIVSFIYTATNKKVVWRTVKHVD